MRCPNCGVENHAGAHFCSNCGQALAAAASGDAATTEPSQPVEPASSTPAGPPGGTEPTQPVPPAAAEPTQPVPPSAAEPTAPVLPPTPSKVMTTPTPPAAPPPGGPAPEPGGPSRKPNPVVLAISGAVAVLVLGLVFWAVFLREDDANPEALPVPTGTPTSEPQTTGATGTTGTTGATGVTGSLSGATGATAATGVTGGSFTVETRMCESVNENGRCLDPYPYDPASGWTIPVTAPSFTVLITTGGLQPGDVISIDFNNVGGEGETYYSTDLEPAPADVVNFEQWIYWLPLVTPTTGSFPPGSTTELVLYHNGEEITFQGPNVYTFG